MVNELLDIRGLTVELPTPLGWVRPVNDVSLRIAKGESVGLVGESGSGENDALACADGFIANRSAR